MYFGHHRHNKFPRIQFRQSLMDRLYIILSPDRVSVLVDIGAEGEMIIKAYQGKKPGRDSY